MYTFQYTATNLHRADQFVRNENLNWITHEKKKSIIVATYTDLNINIHVKKRITF